MTAAREIGAGAPGDRSGPRRHRRAIVAASLGNAFEWYDFIVYALFSIYIAKAFFPGGDPTMELVKAFLAFGLGFVIRPLGAVLLGFYGDYAGRKAVLTLALGIMVAGTAVLALAPTYAAIGVGAPLLILAGRTLQGFSAGGEFGGAAALLVEHAPEGRKGEFTSWLQGSMGLSNIMGAVVAFTVTSLFTRTQVEHFAWRIPFLFGLLIAPIGLWMRSTLDETAEFEQARAARSPDESMSAVGRLLFADHLPMLIRGVGLSTLLTVSSYVLVIFMPVYVQRTFQFAPNQAFAASVVGNVLLVASCVGGGVLSDRIGRRPVLLGAGGVLSVCAYPLLSLLQHHQTMPSLVFVQCFFCVATGMFVGVAPAALAEGFPVRVRSIGVSVCYNLAVTVFSGFAPAALTWIAAKGGGALTPAWYLSFAAVLAAPAVLALPPRRPVSLHDADDVGRRRPAGLHSDGGVPETELERVQGAERMRPVRKGHF